jgi:GNAT superfamily N-acetyltransferase
MSHFLPDSGRKCDRYAALDRFAAMAHGPETRDRLLEFEISLDAASCDEVLEADWGRAYLTPSLPLVWDASWLALEETGMAMGEVAALADEVLGGAGFEHRTVVPFGEEDGRRLVSAVGEAAGWEVELVDYMTWRGDTGRAGAAEVREAPLAEIAALRGELTRESMPEYGGDIEATVPQLLEMDRRIGTAGGDRWFVAPAEDPAAACRLLAAVDPFPPGGGSKSDAAIGQVEDVGTLAAARGRGLAQAVVLSALAASRAAEHEITFLSADAEDWPRLMYEKLGFAKVGEVHVLRRRPAT